MNRREFLAGLISLPAVACASVSRRGTGAEVRRGRLGASTACLAGLSILDALGELKRLGFETVEIISYTGARHSIGEIPGFAFAASSPDHRERVRAATRAFRHISCHLPFQDISLFSSDRAAREAGLERLRDGLNGLAYLNGELAVMHVGWPEKGKRYRDIWTPMVDTLRVLGDYAAERKLRIGIETMQPDSVREYVDLIRAVDHPAVGATIDTGHIRGASDIGLPADRRDTDEARARFDDVLNRLVSALGNKVIHFHLSDVRRTDWVDHKTIGSGAIDFRRLFETIRSIGYRGLFVLELEEPDQREALQRSKDYVERLVY